MRAIPGSMNAEIVEAIDERIDGIERVENVTIPWAIESGSRAWGFPSPDSDYDSRFFYLRSSESYLSLWQPRDVIETPLDKIFDVNGWDIAKAVRLLVKGNGTVTEWLRSPIIYRGDASFRELFLALADEVLDRELLGRHFLHLGLQHWPPASGASLKKIFYALRPAATVRWLERNPSLAVPPMDLPTLLAQNDAPNDVVELTSELIELKSQTREAGTGDVPGALIRFIGDEFERADERYESVDPRPVDAARATSDAFFRSAIERWARPLA